MKLNIQLFATTKTTTFNEPALTDTDIQNNSSTLKITVYFSPNNSVTWFSSATLYCTVNGVQKNQKVSLSKGGSVSATFTFDNISHEADGTKTVAWNWSCATGTSALGTVSASGNRTLQTIPRASQPSLSSTNVNMGNSVTITTNRVSNSFTHNLFYTFGNDSGAIAIDITDTATWTPPVTLANQIPSSTSGTGTITCVTYNGETFIGTKTVDITLNVPSSVVPTVSIGTLTEANAAMQSLNWGVFVQNKSQLNIPITASGAYSSSITSIITTINGLSFSGTPVVTSTLITAGNNTISTTVTDSRGRTATTSKTYIVESYSNPQITTATASRSLSDGTESDEGTYLKYNFVGSISAVSNHNAHTFRIGYKATTDSSYTYTNIDTSNYSIPSGSQTGVLNLNLSTNNSYDIIFEAIDTFSISKIERLIGSGFDLMNFNASGKAMAIGKVSEASANEKILEIDMDVDMTSGELKMDGISRLKQNGVDLYIAANSGNLALRPNGINNTTGQMFITSNGDAYFNGSLNIVGENGNVAKINTLNDVDLNSVGDNYASGLYQVYANDNMPSDFTSDTWFYLMQFNGGDDWKYQELTHWWDSSGNIHKYARRKISGTWEGWKQVW